MLEVIDQHLKDTASPELYSMMEDAFKYFDILGIEDYTLEYTQIMAIGDNESIDSITDSIFETTIAIANGIISNFGITLIDDVSLSAIVNLLGALILIEDYEFQDNFIAIANEALDSEEALCAILDEASGIPAEVFAPIIETVSGSLINTIVHHAQMYINSQIKTGLNKQEVRDKVRKLTDFISKYELTECIAFNIINNDIAIGLDFNDYFEISKDRLNYSDAKATATELYAISLISADTNLQDSASQCLSKTLTSIDAVTAITVALQSITLKEHIAQTSGVKRLDQ